MKTILSISGVSLVGIYGLFLYFTEKDPYRKDFIERLRASRPSFGTYYQTYLQKGLEKLKEWLDTPFSSKALSINTLFATLYAISFFAVSWIIGSSGKIGTISILSESLSTIERISIVLLIVLLFVLAIYVICKDKYVNYGEIELKISSVLAFLVSRLTCIVLIISVALVSKFYILLILLPISLFSPAFTFTVLGAVAVAVVGTGVGAGAYAVVGAGAVVGAVTVTVKAKRKLFLSLYTFNIFIICLVMVGLSLGGKFVEINSEIVAFSFFAIILPFFNGFMDFVSLGISRILSKKIYEDIKHETYKAFVLHFAIDLAAAVLLLVFLVFAVCFGTQLFNIFVAKKPELAIDLPGLIQSAKQAPFGPDGFWITLMLLSTLVPTFAHFVIAFAGTFTIFITPKKLRKKLADLLEQKRNALPALYYTGKTLFGLLFAVVLWGLVGYGINYMANFANMLSKIAYWSIDIANKIPH